MKILWFTTGPCDSMNNKKQITCGWIASLEQELIKISDVDLSVAFYSEEKLAPFEYNNVHYYPIKKTRIERILIRIFSKVSYKYLPDYISIIEKVKPDVIHIHGTEGEFPLIISKTKVPIVLSMQSILSSYVEKYYSGISKHFSWLHARLIDILLFRTYNSIYKLTISTATKEREYYFKLNYIIGRTDWDKNISRLLSPHSTYYHVDEILRAPFYEVKWNKPTNKTLTLVTTMSDSIYKGLETIYKTASIMKVYGLNFVWKVIGQNEDSTYARLTRSYTKINNDDVNVRLMGKMDADGVISELLNSDIFIQVSHIENSPNSLCEAMILGMPIIASFSGGTSSMLKDKKEGLLYQDGDSYNLAGCIKHLSCNFDEAINYGKEARCRASERHNKDTIVNQVLNCYSEIIKDNS